MNSIFKFPSKQKPEVSDAFLTLQVGLVGAYGEWAYSNTLGFQQDLKNPNFFSKKEGMSIEINFKYKKTLNKRLQNLLS